MVDIFISLQYQPNLSTNQSHNMLPIIRVKVKRAIGKKTFNTLKTIKQKITSNVNKTIFGITDVYFPDDIKGTHIQYIPVEFHPYQNQVVNKGDILTHVRSCSYNGDVMSELSGFVVDISPVYSKRGISYMNTNEKICSIQENWICDAYNDTKNSV